MDKERARLRSKIAMLTEKVKAGEMLVEFKKKILALGGSGAKKKKKALQEAEDRLSKDRKELKRLKQELSFHE